MAKSIITSGKSDESYAPYDRVKRVELLLASEGGRWFLDKLAQKEQELLAKATILPTNEAEERAQRIANAQYNLIREINTIVPIEKSSATALLNASLIKEDPTSPQPGPEL